MYYDRIDAFLPPLFCEIHKDALPETSDEDGWLKGDERILKTE